MPISYALLLCVPLGFLFFWIARSASLYIMGRYEQPERRASLAFGVFGALLIPDLWTIGCLEEEFPIAPEMVIPFLVLIVEFFVLALLFRPYPRGRMDDSGRKERVEP